MIATTRQLFGRGPGNGRREAKYALVSEAQAAAIRDTVRAHMEPDPHAAGWPDFRYPLSSLYLDTPALDLYRGTVRGEKNRHKLRIRRYFVPGSPAFFEVKSRVDQIIRKRRAAVRPEAIPELVAGAVPRVAHLHKQSARGLADLLFFRDLMHAARATPRIRVRYFREAWADATENRLRVTFDREVTCSPTSSADVLGEDSRWIDACSLPVILEIKFDHFMPEWVVRLVQRFDLTRTSVPKYVMSVDAARRLGMEIAGRGSRAVM